jgi:hypothetical protein
MAAVSHGYKFGNILLNRNAYFSPLWFQVEASCQGFMDRSDMWDVLPVRISFAYDNFPEVDKADCCHCLKPIVQFSDYYRKKIVVVDEINVKIVSKKRHY